MLDVARTVVITAVHQLLGGDIGGVNQMLAGQEPALGEAIMDARRRFMIGRRGRCGRHIGDDVRRVVIASLGQRWLGERSHLLPPAFRVG